MVIASHLYLYNLQQTNEVPSLNQYLRYVSWSPSGNAIAYVDYNNNLHYRYKVKPSHLPKYSPLGNKVVLFDLVKLTVEDRQVQHIF